jgi:hypothetical protein
MHSHAGVREAVVPSAVDSAHPFGEVGATQVVFHHGHAHKLAWHGSWLPQQLADAAADAYCMDERIDTLCLTSAIQFNTLFCAVFPEDALDHRNFHLGCGHWIPQQFDSLCHTIHQQA